LAQPQVAGAGIERAGAAVPASATVGDSRAAQGRDYLVRMEEAFGRAAEGAGGPLVQTLAIGSRRVRLRFAGDALVGALLPALAHLPVEEDAPRAASEPRGGDADGDVPPDASIDLWDSASTGVPVPPFPWAAADVVARGEVRGYGDDVRVVYEPGFGGVTVFDPISRRGAFWAAARERVPWYERAAPLRPLLHWALAGPGRHLLHAGAVARDGTGVLLAGRGGSGKSTVALLCADAGLDYLGDDYVLLSTQHEPTAFSLYGTAKLAPEGLVRLPGLGDAARAGAGIGPEEAKLVLDVGRRYPGRVRAAAAVGALVLPRVVSGGTTRLVRASAPEALRRLAPSSILQLPYPQPGALASMAALVRRVPVHLLELGGDVSEVPSLIADLARPAGAERRRGRRPPEARA
jgi:hypothetical protein